MLNSEEVDANEFDIYTAVAASVTGCSAQGQLLLGGELYLQETHSVCGCCFVLIE